MEPRMKSGVGVGFLYAYVHFVTEVVCFYALNACFGSGAGLWIAFLIYDLLAFVPQAPLGYLADKRQSIPFGLIGLVLLAAGLSLFYVTSVPYLPLVVLCLGNCCTHISGAEATLRTANGKLAPSAIFVAGGSFGVITGKLLYLANVPFWALILLCLSAVVFVLYGDSFRTEANARSIIACKAFSYHRKTIGAAAVIVLCVFVVAVRGYMGYGIPTSWKKTLLETVLFFCAMGLGKGLGGVLADRFGVRRTAIASTVLALPFLLMGDQLILVSLIGVLLFSMTMSITLAVLVSVLPRHPGLAFGLTTIGLFCGTAPIFFFRFTTVFANSVLIAILTVVCVVALFCAIGKDKEHG